MSLDAKAVADERSAMSELHDAVAGRLAESTSRYTAGRRRLVETLARSERPMTLPDIVASDPGIAPSSAYRNLDVLEQSGVIRRINSSGDHAHFELAEPLVVHHHHLICLGCGKILDVQLDDALERAVDAGLAKAAAKADFVPSHHTLDLYGWCSDCQALGRHLG
ncbi:MAG: Fur family transcriptional regulator [Actinomycetota bacterium]